MGRPSKTIERRTSSERRISCPPSTLAWVQKSYRWELNWNQRTYNSPVNSLAGTNPARVRAPKWNSCNAETEHGTLPDEKAHCRGGVVHSEALHEPPASGFDAHGKGLRRESDDKIPAASGPDSGQRPALGARGGQGLLHQRAVIFDSPRLPVRFDRLQDDAHCPRADGLDGSFDLPARNLKRLLAAGHAGLRDAPGGDSSLDQRACRCNSCSPDDVSPRDAHAHTC